MIALADPIMLLRADEDDVDRGRLQRKPYRVPLHREHECDPHPDGTRWPLQLRPQRKKPKEIIGLNPRVRELPTPQFIVFCGREPVSNNRPLQELSWESRSLPQG